MLRKFFLILAWLLLLSEIVSTKTLPQSHSWRMENDVIAAEFAYFSDHSFRLVTLQDTITGKTWRTFPTSVLDDTSLPGRIAYDFISYTKSRVTKDGRRHTFYLRDQVTGFYTDLIYELYPREPFLRVHQVVHSMTGNEVIIKKISLLDWRFEAPQRQFSALRVNQWKWGDGPTRPERNFEVQETRLTNGNLVPLQAGAHALHCSWAAVRDGITGDGLVIGWEFNGRAEGSIQYDVSRGILELTAEVSSMYHPIAPGSSFVTPSAFIGLFRGDWDEAAYRTQRFVEGIIAKPVPDRKRFPYVIFNSWGYGLDINETSLRQAAKIAADMGVEVFTVDLGWARTIGDWHPDPKKFPHGLRAFSDYIHSLGMKFGLHWALAEADPASPVLRMHPDWRTSVQQIYFQADSLCLGHTPVKQWLIQEGLRIIQEYRVDWLLQDGENMVKVCESLQHAHYARDDNYANAVEGLDAVIAAIQKKQPQVIWENCENGGVMMTYKMTGQYDTSILADNTTAENTRKAVWGGTFPFSPRYSVRYMQDPDISVYTLRSHMFGGPLILMSKLTEWTQAQKDLTVKELRLYKSLRTLIRDSKVIHLLDQPDGIHNDAIAAYNEKQDRLVAFVYRVEGVQDWQLLQLRNLQPNRVYRVRFQNDLRWFLVPGRTLTEFGVMVPLPYHRSAEIVYVEPEIAK